MPLLFHDDSSNVTTNSHMVISEQNKLKPKAVVGFQTQKEA